MSFAICSDAWPVLGSVVSHSSLAQSDERELWSTYVEDFNTSTLPHRKYYNLEFYEQERAAKARKKGVPVVRPTPRAVPLRGTVHPGACSRGS